MLTTNTAYEVGYDLEFFCQLVPNMTDVYVYAYWQMTPNYKETDAQ